MKCLIVFAAVLAVSSAQLYRPFARTAPKAFAARPAYSAAVPLSPARVAAVPVPRASSGDQNAEIVRYENAVEPNGAYNYLFETNNGIAAQEQGTPRDFGGSPPVVPDVAQGSYSYTSPEGVPVSITYVADENGFQPQGDVIPTPHPVPDAIRRSIEYNARNAQKK